MGLQPLGWLQARWLAGSPFFEGAGATRSAAVANHVLKEIAL
jgi:hypothetical protein